MDRNLVRGAWVPHRHRICGQVHLRQLCVIRKWRFPCHCCQLVLECRQLVFTLRNLHIPTRFYIPQCFIRHIIIRLILPTAMDRTVQASQHI